MKQILNSQTCKSITDKQDSTEWRLSDLTVVMTFWMVVMIYLWIVS